MRILVPGLMAAALALSGCCSCPPPKIIGPSWDSARHAFETFQAAVLADRPDVLYESFSQEFKREYGVPGKGEFKLGYDVHKGDFKRIFEDAKILGVEEGYDASTGLRLARVTVEVWGRLASFYMVEIPTARLVYQFEGYGPEVADYGAKGEAFGGRVSVENGVVRTTLDAQAGIESAAEVREVRYYRQWLLRDIRDLPVDLHQIIDELRASAGGAG